MGAASDVRSGRRPIGVGVVLALSLAGVLVAAIVAYVRTAPGVRAIEAHRDLPRATAAHPLAGPARYEGTLHAPAGRVTPAGTPAAAFWWGVATGGDDPETKCQGRERSDLVLRTPDGDMPLGFTEAPPEAVGLVMEEKTDEEDRSILVDIGATKRTKFETIPASTCPSSDATYSESIIVEGARVGVIGCHRDGAIQACDAGVGALLAVGGIDANLTARVDGVVRIVRQSIFGAAWLAGVIGMYLVRRVRTQTRTLRPGRERLVVGTLGPRVERDEPSPSNEGEGT